MYKDLIDKLRNTESRSKRAMLDETADVIERLTANADNDREKLIELIEQAWNTVTTDALKDASLIDGILAAYLIANGVVIQKQGEWINEPPYRSLSGERRKGQECSACHTFYVSDGNKPYSNHKYCSECGAKMR